jgi:hypothetical protein
MRWLYKEIESSKVEKIFFVSRDGYWFHQMFLETRQAQGASIPSEYLLLSRASLHEIVTRIRNRSADLNDLTYFSDSFEGLSSVGIVDLGWTGSSLEMLREISPQIEFTGFFFATHKTKTDGIRSFLGRVRVLKYLGLSEILESLFSAPHRSVKRVVGSPKQPAISFFESDGRLLSIHESLRDFRLQKQEVNTKYWSRMAVKSHLTLLCISPNRFIYDAFCKVNHGSNGEESLKLGLGQYMFSEKRSRAVAPFWSVKAILELKVGAIKKFKLLILLITSQIAFVLARLNLLK